MGLGRRGFEREDLRGVVLGRKRKMRRLMEFGAVSRLPSRRRTKFPINSVKPSMDSKYQG